ncbi:outer membrane beta-barrel protein [Lutibacter citreus]|uniref:outer membrane beta-barrel protein n=1 Tax=Lutibacter citreus TaxID=2138210 RepID=UPI000DBE31BB|nr:outer membrane beta-barrel protein [Lutibacter citreus]
MEDKFDKILSNKIKDLVENNEVPYNPEHWDMLLAKKNKNKKRAFLFWRYAAIVLFGLFAGGLGKYLYDNLGIIKNENQEIIFDTKNDSLRIDSLKNNLNIKITSIGNDSLVNLNTTIAKTDSTLINRAKRKKSEKQPFILDKSLEKVAENTVQKEKKIIQNIEKKEHVIKSNVAFKNDLIVNKDFNSRKDSISNKVELAVNELEKKKDSLNFKEELLAQVEEEILDVKSNQKRIKLGIGLSPILDYYQENESSNVGFSGGVIVEIPLTKRFNINTGVYYADQKLDLNNATNYLADGVSAKESKQVVNKEAVIKGVEIPLNIKYNFNINDSQVFVSAGILSTSYIKENIESEFLVNSRTEAKIKDAFGNNIIQYGLVQLSEKSVIENDSNGFNFANALNFSIGIELPINEKRQSIIIEPYFKYSLQTVTQQKIDLNSAGVHLRYNFGFKFK